MSESKGFFGDHDEMAHIWARIQAFDQVSRFVLFEPAASTMQKINPVGCFNFVIEGLFIYIYFLYFWRKSSKSDFKIWRKKFSNDFALFRNWLFR